MIKAIEVIVLIFVFSACSGGGNESPQTLEQPPIVTPAFELPNYFSFTASPENDGRTHTGEGFINEDNEIIFVAGSFGDSDFSSVTKMDIISIDDSQTIQFEIKTFRYIGRYLTTEGSGTLSYENDLWTGTYSYNGIVYDVTLSSASTQSSLVTNVALSSLEGQWVHSSSDESTFGAHIFTNYLYNNGALNGDDEVGCLIGGNVNINALTGNSFTANISLSNCPNSGDYTGSFYLTNRNDVKNIRGALVGDSFGIHITENIE